MPAILRICKDIARLIAGIGMVIIVFIVLAPSLLRKKAKLKATRF